MKIVIDTSSLIALVRYYLPFDSNSVLFSFIKQKIENHEIIILDKVLEECQYTSKGIVVKELKFISSKKYQISTINISPNKKFYNQVENQFCYKSMKSKLSEVEFENQKLKYLNSADFKIILFANKQSGFIDNEVFVVTEETKTKNDNKLFKKIPEICNILGIEAISLPQLFKKYKLNIKYSIRKNK